MYSKSSLLGIKKNILGRFMASGFLFLGFAAHAQVNFVIMGLKGSQAVTVRNSIALQLSKQKNIRAQSEDALSVFKPSKSIRKNIKTVHQKLSEAKNSYKTLNYSRAISLLNQAVNDYEKDYLYTQETLQGLSTAFFYSALTYLQLGQTERSKQSMQKYIQINYGVESGVSTSKQLSEKKYSPKIQQHYDSALKSMETLPKASLNFVSYKPVQKIWINGQSYAPRDVKKLKFYRGNYYIYMTDQRGLPLYSSMIALKPGVNVLKLDQPKKQVKREKELSYIKPSYTWDRSSKTLIIHSSEKKVLSQLSVRYNINVFIILNSDGDKIYASFLDQRPQGKVATVEVKDIKTIINYANQIVGNNA